MYIGPDKRAEGCTAEGARIPEKRISSSQQTEPWCRRIRAQWRVSAAEFWRWGTPRAAYVRQPSSRVSNNAKHALTCSSKEAPLLAVVSSAIAATKSSA